MLFIQRFLQTIFLRVRMFFGPVTSLWVQARTYMRPGQAIKNQFAGVTARWDMFRARMGSFGNAIIPQNVRKRLGMDKPKRRGKNSSVDGDFGELSDRKARRLAGGRKLKPLQKQAQFSQIHLINRITKARKIAHIGQKIDRSWTEMFIEIDEVNSIRLSFTIVDRVVYGSNVAVTYERGEVEVLVDGQILTQSISLPVFNESAVMVAGVPYVVDLFKYESLPVKTQVDVAWETNVGPVRDDNQDAIGIYQHDDAYMFTIADGVGGGYAGDIVSEYAVKYLLKTFQKNVRHNLSWISILRKAFQHTNAEVRKFVERSPYPAGTTLTTVVIREWTAYIVHVGDSRVYHLRGTQLHQLTDDHRETHPVERTTKYEHIPDDLLPMRDVLVRAIGKRDIIDPQIITMAVQPGDKLLMITDGVTHQVSNDELYQILITESIDDASLKLVELANARDNTDNASVIQINVMEQAYEQDIWRAVESDRVFVGGKNWRLDLSRPHDMNTQYEVPNQVGCMSVLVALLVCAVLWWGIPQLTGGQTADPTSSVAIEEVDETPKTEITTEPTATVIVEPTTVPTEPVAQPTIEPTVTTEPIVASPTASSTPTTFVSRTPVPTVPATQESTATPIPPTSTLRA